MTRRSMVVVLAVLAVALALVPSTCAEAQTTPITDKPMTIEVPMQTQVTYTATASDNVRSLGLYNVSFWDEQKNEVGPSASEPATSVTRSLGPILVDLTLVYTARVTPRVNSTGPVARSAAVTIRWLKPAVTPTVAVSPPSAAGASTPPGGSAASTVARMPSVVV